MKFLKFNADFDTLYDKCTHSTNMADEIFVQCSIGTSLTFDSKHYFCLYEMLFTQNIFFKITFIV